MADDKARIEASLEGANQVASEARKIEGSLVGAGSNIEKKLGGALKSIGGGLANMVQGGLAVAGAFQAINLSKAVEDAKKLDEYTARLGQRAGASGDKVKEIFKGQEKAILTSAQAQAAFSKQLAGLTYDARDAVEGVGALGQVALATGTELGDQLPLAKLLHDMGVPLREAVAQFDKLGAAAERAGTKGGAKALTDILAGVDVQGVDQSTQEKQDKMRGLATHLGKGQTKERAQQIVNATLSMLHGRAADIERATGRRVENDYGQLIDPTATLQDLRALSERRHGGRDEEMRRALKNTYGTDAGLAIYRGGLDKVADIGRANDPGKTDQRADAYRATPGGQREARRVENEAALRDAAGAPILGIGDRIAAALGPWGMIGASAIGGAGGFGGALRLAGRSLLGGGGAAATATTAGEASLLTGGTGLASLLGIGGAMVAPAAAVLHDIGQNRDEMGAAQRTKWAKEIGAEYAMKAQREGMITPEIFAGAQKDSAVLAALLDALKKRDDGLGQQAKQISDAMVESLRRNPLKATLDKDPNAPKPQ